MEATSQTLDLFVKAKCGLINMDGNEKIIYDTPKGDFLFFYPSRNKMTLNKVIGRDTENNMPIVRTEINDKEWIVKNNKELEKILNNL